MRNKDLVNITVVFSHGKETGPDGRKIRTLSAIAESLGAKTVSVDYTDLTCQEERVQRLESVCSTLDEKLILVGSSMGGYVSAVASASIKPFGMILMAPAIGLPVYRVLSPNVYAQELKVFHGWQDDVVPASNVFTWCQSQLLPLQLLDDGHSLHHSLDEIGRSLIAMIKSAKAEPL